MLFKERNKAERNKRLEEHVISTEQSLKEREIKIQSDAVKYGVNFVKIEEDKKLLVKQKNFMKDQEKINK